MTYVGSCFCGSVQVRVTGQPRGMGYCHCQDCRSWSGAPVNAFTIWDRDAVEVVEGAAFLATYQKTERSQRHYCSSCGGHVMTVHPTFSVVDVYAATLPALTFVPNEHVYYGETVLPMRDGLPKYRDLPAGFDGSGELIED